MKRAHKQEQLFLAYLDLSHSLESGSQQEVALAEKDLSFSENGKQLAVPFG